MRAEAIYVAAAILSVVTTTGCRSLKVGEMERLRLRLESLDYAPEELERQAPLECEFVRILRGPDRPDYMLFALSKPVEWKGKKATHLVLAARWVGTSIQPRIRQLPVNIAIVRDQALVASAEFRLEQADYAAIGIATDVSVAPQ